MALYEVEGSKQRTIIDLEKIEFCRNEGDFVVVQINGSRQEVTFESETEAGKFMDKVMERRTNNE